MSDIGHECDTRGEEDMQPRRKPRDEGEADDQAQALFDGLSREEHATIAIALLEFAADVNKRPKDRGALPAGEFDRREAMKIAEALESAVEHAIAARDAR